VPDPDHHARRADPGGAIGGTIAVLADDPAAKTDVPAWCTMKSQEFVAISDLPSGWSFLIKRSY